MEVHPILDRGDSPKHNLWYAVSPEGVGPSVRVGSTAIYKPISASNGHSSAGQVMVAGGANPDGSFADLFILDLETFKWDSPKCPGLLARYEHSAFIPKSHPERFVVFGGAQQDQNLNDVQVIDTVTGPTPSPRTCHGMAAVGDKLFVFGGGHKGADPVDDNQMHVYNAETDSWSQLTTSGEQPCCRHGHIMVAIGTSIFLHGGMAGSDMFDDLFQFNTENNSWTKLNPTGDVPPSRTAHAAVAIGHRLYLFGGMNGLGMALDDFYVLETETCKWSRIRSDGLPPNPRLDHAMCTILLPKITEEAPSSTPSENNESPPSQLLFVFGGMDTQGNIFNDCFFFSP
ncbi:predicted protein [Nematostella vectensis]|uniref:Rab9 effector protein with kelch motifs n=1 Tax=Nematostella vectensis TaxID=45351 RepID=A7RGV9_NEMVE|nr:predicted protein [Nematostella vectensis]|eukprot:XP_001641302.1 predicted protein [Nematostella vectensis]